MNPHKSAQSNDPEAARRLRELADAISKVMGRASELSTAVPGLTRPATRHCVPNLCGLIFVLQRRPTDSVTRSLRLDAHGKSLSSLMLSLEI
jgi:hypothetical protein